MIVYRRRFVKLVLESSKRSINSSNRLNEHGNGLLNRYDRVWLRKLDYVWFCFRRRETPIWKYRNARSMITKYRRVRRRVKMIPQTRIEISKYLNFFSLFILVHKYFVWIKISILFVFM